MTAFALLWAECFACRRTFASNPARVPSYANEPICAACMVLVNVERERRGLPLWEIAADAYDAVEEWEL